MSISGLGLVLVGVRFRQDGTVVSYNSVTGPPSVSSNLICRTHIPFVGLIVLPSYGSFVVKSNSCVRPTTYVRIRLGRNEDTEAKEWEVVR